MERATQATCILPPESQALARPADAREYHVSFDGLHWNVTTAEGEMSQASFDRDMAMTLAIRAAQQDHADGVEVMVCIEELDGTLCLAWASP
jgi:hypothetical protein